MPTPTSATGTCSTHGQRHRQFPARLTGGNANHRNAGRASSAGFTLIELLVAMIIAAVIVSMVAISGSPSPARALETDADRLALGLPNSPLAPDNAAQAQIALA